MLKTQTFLNLNLQKGSALFANLSYQKLLFSSLLLCLALSLLSSSEINAQNPWTQLGQTINGEAGGDRSGHSVSLSADGARVAIGAYENDGNGDASGHVRIYDYDSILDTLVQVGSDIDGKVAGDQSGWSVSLSGDGTRVVIGAIKNDDRGDDAGLVRVYKLDNGNWIQEGNDIIGEATQDESGWSVSISSNGSRVAVGAPFNGNNNAGHVRVYDLVGNTWTQVGADIDGQSNSGFSISLSADGNRLAIGDPLANGAFLPIVGKVSIYDLVGNAWTQVGADIFGQAPGNFANLSVSLSSDGTHVAIGAPTIDQVQVFSFGSGSWSQVGSSILGESDEDFGSAVSLSVDGSRLAIGIEGNDDGGVNAGQVQVYDFNSSAWEQVGLNINGNAPAANFGTSVSLSSDGAQLAVGASFETEISANSPGYIQIFEERVFRITEINNINQGTDSGQCGANITLPDALFVNSVGVVNITTSIGDAPGASSFFAVGQTTVTYEATDAGSGQTATESFTVTITDDEPPVITGCPSDTTIELANGENSVVFNFSTPMVSDNCTAIIESTGGPASGSSLQVGTTTISFRATDGTNEDTCSFDVTIIPAQLQITGLNDITQSNDQDSCNATIALPVPSFVNNVGIISTITNLGIQPDENYTFPVGATEVIYTATDAGSMQIAKDTITVTITDDQAPIIECTTDTIVEVSISATSTMVYLSGAFIFG